MDVNTGGTEVNDGTTYTSPPFYTGFTVTLRIRATTGTYFSVPAVSDVLAISVKKEYFNLINQIFCYLKPLRFTDFVY